MTSTSDASDIRTDTWVDRVLPDALRPFAQLARLDRPFGTWLLLLPCWWGLAMATPGLPDWRAMALFAVGALAMRGAGCTVNDIADREFDAKVARTAMRPIASGAVTVTQAALFLGLQLAIGLTVLFQFNSFTFKLAVASLALVAVYPFAKRVTYWPQLVLGFTFNWGALVGWAAVTGSLGWPAVAAYAAGVFWTLGYDTVYAHSDKNDDAIVGVKSSALALGERTRPWLIAFYAATLSLLAVAGHLAGLGWGYYAGLALGALHMAWQVKILDIDHPPTCLRIIRSNRDFGLIVFAAMVAGQLT